MISGLAAINASADTMRSLAFLRPDSAGNASTPPAISMSSATQRMPEIIEIAGGVDVFPALSRRKNAKDRIVSGEELIAAKPDIIVGSWCGKKFVPAKVAARPGFSDVPAVRDNFVREIKSPLILQPGPAALTDGLDALAAIIEEWAAARPAHVERVHSSARGG